MKKMKILTVLVMLFATAGFLSDLEAAEETGKIIEKLVADVDRQLTSLEELADKNAGEKERLKSELDVDYAKYDEAEDGMEKAKLRGDVVNLLAKMNGIDRKEVKATMETVVGVSESLRQLNQTARGSKEFNPESIKEQKSRMSSFVKNAAKIVKIMEQVNDSPNTQNRTVALKNSLIMLYKQLQDPITGTESSLARIEETIRTLEDVAVQLNILQGLLENERVMLVTATHVQTVDLALLRLARARLGADSVADIPGKKHEDIMARMRKARDPVTDSNTSLVGSSQPFDPVAWEMIEEL